MRSRDLVLASVLALALAAVRTAAADQADALFKKGKKLLAEKKYPEACKAFEQVDQLDPGIGAKLNVARCFEEWGRLATAYRWYGDAEKMARDSKDDRAAKIRALIEDVDSNVPRVTIKIPEGADPGVIDHLTLDGEKLDVAMLGAEQRVDPGPHVIEYTVNGVAKKKMAPVERGGSSEVTLEVPHTIQGGKKVFAPPKRPAGSSAPSAPGHTQRLLGLGLAGAGVVTVGIAGVLTLSARGTYQDALAAHCMGSTSMCDPEGLTTTHDARHTANIATVVTLLGVAAVGGGVVLYLLAPDHAAASDEHALYVSPVVDAQGGGLVFGGRY